ncbi:MAG TPA: serine/threonine-protein kinase, partial [Thermoanaerobaculia bacterium]|nr:serine/threonine-protein kinase [Thermoanaerobaculia bacterium]
MLDGKYEIVGLLGAGGMGEVYKVRHVHLGAYRCVKVMKAGLLADDTSRGRFLREARLATQIHHPNVAVVHDFSIMDDGTSFMVTEYIDGTTVRQWSAKNGRFPLALAADVATQVLNGLDHIHRRGLLHRDISADNIMMQYDTDEHLIAKIIDLGVAKDVSGGIDTTHSGLIVGNPKYMSPEQLGELEEGEQIDGRADLYSLGVVLYEMLLGVPPFQARTPNQYIVKHLTQPVPPFREVQPDLEFPAGLETVIFKTLEKDRKRRFSDARSFAYALLPFATRELGTFTRAEVLKLQPTLDETIAENVPEVRSDVAWMRAVAADSYVAFRDFLAQYPVSAFSYEAQRAIAERMAFDTAAAMDTEDAWLDYLERWGSDRHAPAAKQRLEASRAREETAWAVASEMKTATAWQAYLEEFPDANRSARAETNRREALAFEQAREGGRAALEQFLRGYPNGMLAKDVKRLLKQRADDDDFAHARSLDTVAAWTL